MKHEQLLKLLKTMKDPPVYQCPHCHTVWLIAGGQTLRFYTCETCEGKFVPAQSRYPGEPKPDACFKLPRAA